MCKTNKLTPQGLVTGCWVPRNNDAWIIVSGQDSILHILSLAESKEIAQLSGHKGPVLDLQAHPLDTNLVLSVGTDGTVRLWHLEAQKFLVVFVTDSTVAVSCCIFVVEDSQAFYEKQKR